MRYRTLIAFTTVVALGCVPVTSSAFAAGHAGSRGAGGHASAGHAAGGRAMGGSARVGVARGYAGGRRVGRGYGGGYGPGYGYGYGGSYGCNGYDYNYNGCNYDPGAAIVGGLIGGALNGFGAY
jgi:hypothetical protein